MNKRKILVMAMALAMCAILVVGGTLAYFTDTEQKINTFTAGEIDITLNENFDEVEAGKIVPGTSNAIKKEVSITNDGKNDAWVWYTVEFPRALNDIEVNDELWSILRLGFSGASWDEYYTDSRYADDANKASKIEETWHIPMVPAEEEVGGYYEEDGKIVYTALLNGKLPVGETTKIGLKQVYLESYVRTVKTVDADGNEVIKYYVQDVEIPYDMSQPFDIVVKAYAIQDNNFANVQEAHQAYYAQEIY